MLEVTKMRGMEFDGGYHDFRIQRGGLDVFPRLRITSRSAERSLFQFSSGIETLDTLFGGGLEGGTSCLVVGTSGAGKSTLASLYVQAAAQRGERSVIFCFDERRETFLHRSAGLGLAIERHIEKGLIDLRQIDVGVVSSGEFIDQVRRSVDDWGAKVLVIDSLTGYVNAMPEERLLMTQLHELVSYSSGAGILTIMVVAFSGVIGDGHLDLAASYIADTVVLMRHFEAGGELRRCLSVVKKRHGDHERTIRELSMGRRGIVVGRPLSEFSGLLSGSPVFSGDAAHLMHRPAADPAVGERPDSGRRVGGSNAMDEMR
jgi:circadian clock protein KaiC